MKIHRKVQFTLKSHKSACISRHSKQLTDRFTVGFDELEDKTSVHQRQAAVDEERQTRIQRSDHVKFLQINS